MQSHQAIPDKAHEGADASPDAAAPGARDARDAGARPGAQTATPIAIRELTKRFGNTLAVDLAPIPIPAAVWLFGSGLIGLVVVARRTRSRT